VAASTELTGFVQDSLARGLPKSGIQAALMEAGWQPAEVRDALNGFADVEYPIPVPRPKPYVSAREAFLYLVLFTALFTVAINFGNLAFTLIDQWLPDPAADFRPPREFVAQAMRWSISSLIVATPLFLWVSSFLGRQVRRDPVKRASKIRRWLTYMTLFVAATVLTGDVTMLVYNVLGGELTLRFLLKVGVVGGIAGSAFAYYFSDLRRDEEGAAS
jgi:MFS family permease